MSNPVRRCCVCGLIIGDRELTHMEMVGKHMETIRKDGTRLYHCPTHTTAEIKASINNVPNFEKAGDHR